MKILISPEWLDLVRGLTNKDKAEILIALLSYPDSDCKIHIWDFMRKQIDRDADKYRERCKNLSENRQKRWPREQTDDRNNTDAHQNGDTRGAENGQQTPNSAVIASSIDSEKHNENSIERKNDVDRILRNAARSMDANAPAIYEITDDFDFYAIEEIKYRLYPYNDAKIRKARASLIAKRLGQKLTAEQILKWISSEGEF